MNTQQSTPDFYEIYEYYTPPFYQTLSGKICIAILVLGIIGLITYAIIKRRRNRKLEPWEWATEKLKTINLEQCKNKDDYKKFYFSLSSIIKTYLNKRFDWHTEDKTDDELVLLLHSKGFEQQSLDMIKKMAEGSLWIKFANETVLKAQAEADLKTAFKIIDQTKPIQQKS